MYCYYKNYDHFKSAVLDYYHNILDKNMDDQPLYYWWSHYGQGKGILLSDACEIHTHDGDVLEFYQNEWNMSYVTTTTSEKGTSYHTHKLLTIYTLKNIDSDY